MGRIFTAHYACRNTEMELKSMTANRFNFQIITLKFTGIFGSGGGGIRGHLATMDNTIIKANKSG